MAEAEQGTLPGLDDAWEQIEGELDAFLSPTLYVAGAPAPVARVGVLPRIFAHALVGRDAPRVVLAEDATRWRKTHADVVAAAIARVGEREVSLVPIAPDTGAAIFRLAPFVGSSSLLLVPGMLSSLEARLGGPAASAIPSADVCLVTSASEPEQIAALFELARELWLDSEHPLSPMVYRLGEDGLVHPYTADDDGGPLFDAASRATRLLEARAYDDQKRAILEALGEGAERPVIADLDVVPLPRAGWTTSTVMLDDRDALLPIADNVFLSWDGEDGPRRAVVPREVLDRVAPGCLLRLSDFDPARELAVRFPTERELAALWDEALMKEAGPVDPADEAAPSEAPDDVGASEPAPSGTGA
jgi:hypothetical protein